MEKMRANVFHGTNDIRVEEVERPRAGVGDAVIRVTLTTICGTDLHIVKGEYAVKPGLIIGHEPVGVIEELGAGVTGYAIGDRVLVGGNHAMRPVSSMLVGSAITEGKMLAEDLAEIGKRKAQRMIRRGREVGEDYLDETAHYVKHHPWQSVGIAAGVGAFVGCLFGWACSRVYTK